MCSHVTAAQSPELAPYITESKSQNPYHVQLGPTQPVPMSSLHPPCLPDCILLFPTHTALATLAS